MEPGRHALGARGWALDPLGRHFGDFLDFRGFWSPSVTLNPPPPPPPNQGSGYRLSAYSLLFPTQLQARHSLGYCLL